VRLALRVEQNVSGLEVTVKNGALMRVVDGPGDFSRADSRRSGYPAVCCIGKSLVSVPPSMNFMLYNGRPSCSPTS